MNLKIHLFIWKPTKVLPTTKSVLMLLNIALVSYTNLYKTMNISRWFENWKGYTNICPYSVRGIKKASITSSSPDTSTKVDIILCLTFILIFLPHWCKISRPLLVAVPNYWPGTKTTTQKSGFCSKNHMKFRLW